MWLIKIVSKVVCPTETISGDFFGFCSRANLRGVPKLSQLAKAMLATYDFPLVASLSWAAAQATGVTYATAKRRNGAARYTAAHNYRDILG